MSAKRPWHDADFESEPEDATVDATTYCETPPPPRPQRLSRYALAVRRHEAPLSAVGRLSARQRRILAAEFHYQRNLAEATCRRVEALEREGGCDADAARQRVDDAHARLFQTHSGLPLVEPCAAGQWQRWITRWCQWTASDQQRDSPPFPFNASDLVAMVERYVAPGPPLTCTSRPLAPSRATLWRFENYPCTVCDAQRSPLCERCGFCWCRRHGDVWCAGAAADNADNE